MHSRLCCHLSGSRGCHFRGVGFRFNLNFHPCGFIGVTLFPEKLRLQVAQIRAVVLYHLYCIVNLWKSNDHLLAMIDLRIHFGISENQSLCALHESSYVFLNLFFFSITSHILLRSLESSFLLVRSCSFLYQYLKKKGKLHVVVLIFKAIQYRMLPGKNCFKCS